MVPEETSLLERRTIFAWYGMDGNRMTVGEWSSVFGNVCLQATGKTMTPMAARHLTASLVGDGIEGGPTVEQAAAAMGHTEAQQKRTYDKDKTSRDATVGWPAVPTAARCCGRVLCV